MGLQHQKCFVGDRLRVETMSAGVGRGEYEPLSPDMKEDNSPSLAPTEPNQHEKNSTDLKVEMLSPLLQSTDSTTARAPIVISFPPNALPLEDLSPPPQAAAPPHMKADGMRAEGLGKRKELFRNESDDPSHANTSSASQDSQLQPSVPAAIDPGDVKANRGCVSTRYSGLSHRGETAS